MEGFRNVFSQIFQSIEPEDGPDKELLLFYQKKIQKFYSDFLNMYMKKSKVKVEKIRYVTNDVVEVTLEIQMLDMSKIMEKTFKNMRKDGVLGGVKPEEIERMSQKELIDKVLTREFDEMKKAIDTVKDYSIMKAGIYLEKDNNKWGIAELDEKIQNMKDIYKSAGKK